MFKNLLLGSKALLNREKRNSELEEELQAYIRDSIEAKLLNGLSREDAERETRIEVGSLDSVKHKVWKAGWESTVDTIGGDAKYTFRRLARSPWLALTIALSLGLGVAANATVFSLVRKFILSPTPFGHSETLTTIYVIPDKANCCSKASLPLYRDIRDQAKSFDGVSAWFELLPASLGGDGDPERVWGQAATTNFFDVAKLQMPLGRGFISQEEHAQVIVLGYQLWKTRFSGDPQIVGKTVTLSGHLFTVVGVAPRNFRGMDQLLDPQFWVPLSNATSLYPYVRAPERRAQAWLRIAARLKEGVTLASAGSEMAQLAQRFALAHQDTDKGERFLFEPAGSLAPGDKRGMKFLLLAFSIVAFLVLCIACANISNLLLAQGAQRKREMAIRLALGATRIQLLRQLMFENICLALMGGAIGAAVSIWATAKLSSFRLPISLPVDLSVGVDWRVLLYTFALSLLASLIFGFLPAWNASRPIMPNALKGEDMLAKPGTKWSVRSALVVFQVTLSLILLCASGLFLRSLERATKIDVGFRANEVLFMGINPQLHAYTAAKTVRLLRTVRDRIAHLPGVISVTTTDEVPLSILHAARSNQIMPMTAEHPLSSRIVDLYMIGPQYFETLGIPVLAGRGLGEESPDGPKVAVVNEEFVRTVLHGANALGATVKDGDLPYEIVGIVKNAKSKTLGEDPQPVLYRSLSQTAAAFPSYDGYKFMIRYKGDAAGLSQAVRKAILTTDSTLAIFDTATMEEHLQDA